MKYITIFGSSLPEPGDTQYTTAYETGYLLAKGGYGVCTGGNRGIMEAASKGAVDAGGEALGITVSMFNASNAYLTQKIACTTLFERIETLIEKGEAYIILQGGTGTLLELAAVWEYINKGLMPRKPVAAHSPLWKDVVGTLEEQIRFEKREGNLVSCFSSHQKMVEWVLSALTK